MPAVYAVRMSPPTASRLRTYAVRESSIQPTAIAASTNSTPGIGPMSPLSVISQDGTSPPGSGRTSPLRPA